MRLSNKPMLKKIVFNSIHKSRMANQNQIKGLKKTEMLIKKVLWSQKEMKNKL